jgi:16S rRNA (guanine527-N7)-methyltransferase
VTEEEARGWLAERFPADRIALLEQYVAQLLAENQRQNLISRSSEATVWGRHIVDSAQLLSLAPEAGSWMDIGSGPGLPGIVLAILSPAEVLLVEPRARRVAFLRDVVERLSLTNTALHQAMIDKVPDVRVDAITARAWAPLDAIFSSTIRFTGPSTAWVLPKGRSAETELAAARRAWQGVFHVEPSVTDDSARIVVARGVRKRR